MSERIQNQHPSAEELQALLEGELPEGERSRLEAHLARCARCAGELGRWEALFRELAELPSLAPSVVFAERVLAGVKRPEPLSLAARARALIGLPDAAAHPTGDCLQDLLEGLLPPRRAAQVRRHLQRCPACAEDAMAWHVTFSQLGALERLAPADGFTARVMAGVRVPAPVPARVPEWRRALAWARGMVPRTRRAWAAVSGVAVTPAVTLGLVLWTLVSHPTLTPGALASFVEWKVSALAAGAWEALASRALQSPGLFEAYSYLASLAWSPAAMAGALAALSVCTVAATWVLYRNLFTPHPVDGRVAHASHS